MNAGWKRLFDNVKIPYSDYCVSVNFFVEIMFTKKRERQSVLAGIDGKRVYHRGAER